MTTIIIRPITPDGLVGYDRYDQLMLRRIEVLTNGEERNEYTFVRDVRGKTCAVCGGGWESNSTSMADQEYWNTVESWVHKSCGVRFWSLRRKLSLFEVLCSSGISFEGLKEIPNEYWPEGYAEKKEPWYEVRLIDREAYCLVVGRRKRVWEVVLKSKTDKLDEGLLREAEKLFSEYAHTKIFRDTGVVVHAWEDHELRSCLDKVAEITGPPQVSP